MQACSIDGSHGNVALDKHTSVVDVSKSIQTACSQSRLHPHHPEGVFLTMVHFSEDLQQ
jgi:hypothetical protein